MEDKKFRDLEFKYLKECLNTFEIISTGGGIIENKDSLKLLKMKRMLYGLIVISMLFIDV